MLELTQRERELTRWTIECALEVMADSIRDRSDYVNLAEDAKYTDLEDKEYINLESVYDGLIENWQEYADEELEDIQTGLAAFVMQGCGRFGRSLDEDRLKALRAEQMKYIIGGA